MRLLLPFRESPTQPTPLKFPTEACPFRSQRVPAVTGANLGVLGHVGSRELEFSHVMTGILFGSRGGGDSPNLP